MAKFYGIIGYSMTQQTAPGVWSETFVEHTSRGDVLEDSKRWEKGENLNDDLNVSNTISIVADSFVWRNLHCIRYVEWMGALWKVTNVKVARPRLILTIGGVFNGQQG